METLAVLKNGVHFTTPELKALGVRHKEAKREYEEKQAGLVEKAVETAATYLPLVESASTLVSVTVDGQHCSVNGVPRWFCACLPRFHSMSTVYLFFVRAFLQCVLRPDDFITTNLCCFVHDLLMART